MTAALSARNVTVMFGAQKALESVDLSIEPREIRALVGANGSGKSTFVKVLSGLYQPDDSAEISVAGHALAIGTPGAGEEAGLRFVHQDLGLVEDLDVMDNLAIGHGYRFQRAGMISWRREAAAATEALQALGHDIDVRRPVGELTISERTAVAIARALSPRRAPAHMLVLDEPTANLPFNEADRLFDLIRRVRDTGTAILFISHHFAEVFALADTITVLRDGRHIVTDAVANLDDEKLVTHVVGKELARETAFGAPYVPQGDVIMTVSDLAASVIEGLDLTLHEGEIVGIAGITGSGREEIAGTVFGDVPRSGAVSVGGREVPPYRPHASIRMGIGLVPAERRLNAAFAESTLRENVTVIDTSDNLSRGLISQRAERREVSGWLERLGVKPREPEARLENLSGGNQQKVILARWLRQGPKVLVLDDPTQGVDVGAKAEIHRLIKDAARDGMGVLVASTDDEELVALCHRVLVLQAGRISHELHAPDITLEELTACTVGAIRNSA